MGKGRVLVVDDERVTLTVICHLLEDSGYEVVAADNGTQALDILTSSAETFDAVVLDRVMPEMGGMEVLSAIRAQDRLANIPVILLTASSSPEDMRQGIDAGAFYYITKPFDEAIFLAVVRSAVHDHQAEGVFMDQMTADMALVSGVSLLDRGRFRFSTPDQAKSVAWVISQLTDETAEATDCLRELFMNAIEHGNLAMGGALKEQLILEHRLDAEIERRLALPECAGKVVVVEFKVEDGSVMVSVADQGDGFAWEPYLTEIPNLENKVQGRGIWVARAMSAHSLVYEDGGRRAIVRFNPL